MSVYSIFFYLIAAVMILSTALAVTRKNMVHAVLFLVISFLASALLFFLLGAPLPGILEVVIYAGAIMVLFLFVVMMIRIRAPEGSGFLFWHYLGAGGLSAVYVAACLLLIRHAGPGTGAPMAAAVAAPADFGQYLFERHWLGIEIVSLLLLVALIGVFHLGLSRAGQRSGKGGAH